MARKKTVGIIIGVVAAVLAVAIVLGVVIVVPVVGLGVYLAVDLITYEEEYTATASLLVVGYSSSNMTVVVSDAVIEDCLEQIVSDALLQRVINDNGMLVSVEELREMITASRGGSTGIIEVSVTAGTPEDAARAANALAETASEYLDEQLGYYYTVEFRKEAKAPTAPSNSTILGTIFG